MTSCDVCMLLFNDSTRLPLFLPCTHTFCRSCVIQISVSGQFECPVDQKTFPMNDVDTLPLNRIILSQLDSIKVKCCVTAADDATQFCKVHFRMLCDNCVCAQGTDCEFLAIQDVSEIKYVLVKEIDKCPKERLSSIQRQRLTRPMALELSELVTLLAAANDATEPLVCSGCHKDIRFVDRANVELYCHVCTEILREEDPELAASFLPYVESSDSMRNALRSAVQQRLYAVDFHSLSQEQTHWLRSNSMPFRTFYRIAKELVNLSMSEQASGKPFPDTFHCPCCSKSISNQEYVLRRLPCRFAFHAICSSCAQVLATEASLQCPIDGSCFYTSAIVLPEVRQDYPTKQIDTEQISGHSRESDFKPLPKPPSSIIPAVPTFPRIVSTGMHLEPFITSDCPSCNLCFTLTDRRPKKLPCAHLLCQKCVEILSNGRELRCPQDGSVHIVNEFIEFPEDMLMIEKLEAARLPCHYHQDAEASVFCPTHLLALCEQCLPQESCEGQLNVYRDSETVKYALCKAADDLNTDLVPQTLKLCIRNKFKISTHELLNLCTELKSVEYPQQCIKCSSSSLDFVNLSDMCLYCTKCYDRFYKYSEFSTHFVPFNEDCRHYIYWVIMTKLQKIDFCDLSLSHYQLMYYPTGNLLKYLAGAKEIVNLENNPRKSESTLPYYFLCPNCKTVFAKFESQFRRLPCRDVFHALCETCARASSTDVTCPLDQQTYHTSYTELPAFNDANYLPHAYQKSSGKIMKSSLPNTDRRIVGRGTTLSDKGIPIPPFQPQLADFAELRAADRFRAVLPPENPIPGLHADEKLFMEPWFINYYENQVEALSFRCYDNALLWGVGLANPTFPGAQAVVQWVRLYDGEKAVGPYYTEVRLLNCHLVGGNGVITDIYFEAPCFLQILQFVTLKVKISSLGSDEPLAVYHGNHLSRFEDVVGTDELTWETCLTSSVEGNEKNSGQQHYTGPFLRFIYQR